MYIYPKCIFIFNFSQGRYYAPPTWYVNSLEQASTAQKGGSVRMRARGPAKPRPKTMHFGSEEQLSANSSSRKGSSQNLAAGKISK